MAGFDPQAHADTAKGPARGPHPDAATSAAEALAALAARMADDLDGVTDRATRRILEQIAAYQAGDEVPRDDLWWSVRRNVEVVIHAIATGEAPDAEALAVRRELGVRRAQQGLALSDLMRAFRIGYLAVWDVLFELAEGEGPEAIAALASDAALVWNTMDQVSSAVEDGYRDQLALTGQDERRRATAFVQAIRDGRVPEGRALLGELGHPPSSLFDVIALDRRSTSRVERRDTIVSDLVDHTILLRVTTGERHEPIDLQGATHAGIARGPVGLAELDAAIADAEQALAAARALQEPVLRHDEHWFECLVLARDARLPDRVRRAATAFLEDPEMARTIEACLAHDGNVSRAAGDLHLHPNGVTYRLSRFADSHGIDPRTSHGCVDARAALTLARASAALG